MPPPSPKHFHFLFAKARGPRKIGPPPRSKVDQFFVQKERRAPAYDYGGYPFRWTIRKSEKM